MYCESTICACRPIPTGKVDLLETDDMSCLHEVDYMIWKLRWQAGQHQSPVIQHMQKDEKPLLNNQDNE